MSRMLPGRNTRSAALSFMLFCAALGWPVASTFGGQFSKLWGAQNAQDDDFGKSVALSHDTALVGMPGNHFPTQPPGSAYVFDATTGQELRTLVPSDSRSGNYFGWSVALSGHTAIVGAHHYDNAITGAGAAYVFDTTTGNQLFKLSAADGTPGDYFGWSVALSGNLAVVGANTNKRTSSIFVHGAAYVFDITTGQQISKLTAADTESRDFFADKVAISGNTALVGAFGDDGKGSVYAFDALTGQLRYKLTERGDFGSSIAVDGDTAIIGAPFDDPDGAAYLYDLATGQQLLKVTAPSSASADRLGSSVALGGNFALVGDPRADNQSGAVFLFDTTDGQLLAKFRPDDVFGGGFGSAVAMFDDMALMSVPSDDAAYAYLYGAIPEPDLLAYVALAGCGYLCAFARRRVS